MNSNKIFFTAFLILFSLSIISAKNQLTPEQKEKAEINYLAGLNSDNEGLRVSSAYFLGEIKSSKAVIPLMKMLRNDKSESARTVAALSLIKLGDARGIHLVKKAIEFNDFEKVRCRCAKFYSGYLCEKNPQKAEEAAQRIVSVFD